jgi:hypothetical protein
MMRFWHAAPYGGSVGLGPQPNPYLTNGWMPPSSPGRAVPIFHYTHGLIFRHVVVPLVRAPLFYAPVIHQPVYIPVPYSPPPAPNVPLCTFQVVQQGTLKPWKNPGITFQTCQRKYAVNMTGAQLIYALGGSVNTNLTEFIELGDGCFSKGRTMHAGDAKYHSKISKLGWSEKRDENNPVLLYMHEWYVTAPSVETAVLADGIRGMY